MDFVWRIFLKGVSGEPAGNSQVLNPPSGGSAGHVDRRGVYKEESLRLVKLVFL